MTIRSSKNKVKAIGNRSTQRTDEVFFVSQNLAVNTQRHRMKDCLSKLVASTLRNNIFKVFPVASKRLCNYEKRGYY